MPRSSRRTQSVLDFVLPDLKPGEVTADEMAQAVEQAQPQIIHARMVEIERIRENPDNPRKSLGDGPLRELAMSIAERGMLQPLVVRRDPAQPGHYIVIAGSRRLLAARLVHGDHDEAARAGVDHLPCIIKDVSDRDAFADALLENLARTDLTRTEMMEAILRLHEEYGWSANYIAKRTGRNQHDVSEMLKVAKDPALSALVRHDVIKPTVAGEITRLPAEIREDTVADVHAGKIKTVADVKRRKEVARRTDSTGPASAHEGSDITRVTAPELVHPAALSPADRVSDITKAGSSIETAPSTRDGRPATGRDGSVPATRDRGREAEIQAARERTQAIDAFLTGLDAATSQGHAVLVSVRRDLDAAYDKLAAYVQVRNRRGE